MTQCPALAVPRPPEVPTLIGTIPWTDEQVAEFQREWDKMRARHGIVWLPSGRPEFRTNGRPG